MTAIEVGDFLNFLREMFPDWKPTDWQLKTWQETLEHCEFEGSRRGMKNWHAEATRVGKDPILGIFNKVKVVDKRTINAHDPILLFAIARLDKLERETKVFHPRPPIPADHVIEQMADWTRQRAENMYGGDWVVIRHWENKAIPPDDGLRGDEARKKAEQIVLSGPDSPGKRFLLAGGSISRPVLKSVPGALTDDQRAKRVQMLKQQVANFPKCTFCGTKDYLKREGEYMVCPACTKSREPGEDDWEG